MKRTTVAKPSKVEKTDVDFRIWCERCCIRLAPNEERAVHNGKKYHASCYAKLNK